MPVTAITVNIVNMALFHRVISEAVCQRLADERRVGWSTGTSTRFLIE